MFELSRIYETLVRTICVSKKFEVSKICKNHGLNIPTVPRCQDYLEGVDHKPYKCRELIVPWTGIVNSDGTLTNLIRSGGVACPVHGYQYLDDPIKYWQVKFGIYAYTTNLDYDKVKNRIRQKIGGLPTYNEIDYHSLIMSMPSEYFNRINSQRDKEIE